MSAPKLREKDIARTCCDGARFGRLTVLGRSSRKDGKNAFWECLCDCGNKTTVTTARLHSGHTSSCGCWRDESRDIRAKKRINPFRRERRIWYGMIQRCHNPNNRMYRWYGARGIKVCSAWRESFRAFLADMGEGGKNQLDRRNNDGDYEPANCRWTTPKEQANNRRSNRFIEYCGDRLTISQWSKLTGIPQWKLSRELIQRGKTPAEVFGGA